MTTKINVMAVLLSMAVLAACEKDEDPIIPDEPQNEEELITTMRITLASAGGSQVRTLSFMDADGDGGGAPVITGDTLSADTVYTAAILLLNESVSPADTISHEVEEEGAAHQFFFQWVNADVSVTYADADVNGQPIGLLSTWTANSVSTGTVLVTLRHEPDKSAAGVALGDIFNAGGETDIAVTVPVVVQ